MTDFLHELNSDNGCPQCGSNAVEPVKYTWWGGWLGPKLFHHTKCLDCNCRFNSKTRKSNTLAIVIYSIVFFLIAFAVFFLLRNYR